MPSLRFLGAAAALLAVGAQAQDDDDYEVWGNTTSIGTFEGSSISPNASLSADFRPADLEDEWTWRVNVTSIPRPGARAPTGLIDEEPPELEDPHIVRTTWDLSWPGSGNITDNIGNATKVCVAIIERQDWPANVSSLYQEKANGNYDTSCAPIIGDACVSAFIRDQLYNPETDSCGNPRSVTSLDECRDSIGFGRDLSVSMSAIDLSQMSTLGASDGFYNRYLEAHNGTDAERYLKYAEDQIQMALTEMVYVEDNIIRTGRQLHCIRANPAKEVVKSPEDDDDDDEEEENQGSGNNSDGDDDSGAGTVRSGGVAWVVTFASAAALSVALA